MKLIFTQPLKPTAMNKSSSNSIVQYSLPSALADGLQNRNNSGFSLILSVSVLFYSVLFTQYFFKTNLY
jgi:hypothetical protein